MRISIVSGLAALALLAALPAQAQPRRNADAQKSLVASAAVSSVEITAGGSDRNAVPGSGCSGFINNGGPSATVQFDGDGPLAIYATSDIDTTLLVADPAGRWHCSDDANGSNPAVTFARGSAGTYTVWVGTFSPDAAGASARVHTIRGQPTW